MNTISEETREDGKQRRKSIGTPNRGSGGGQGGGLTVSGGKTRRYSIGVTSSRKSIEEDGKIVPNYLRASTGSCHDFCKYGKKHEHSKSAIPVKFKRPTLVNKDKVIPVERKPAIKPFTDPKIQTPVELTKKNVSLVSLTSKKPQISKRALSTNGKPKEIEVKSGQQSTLLVKPNRRLNDSTYGVKKKDIKTVKKTGVTPTDVKKAVLVKSQSPKASSFSRAGSLKAIKHKNVKHVSPLKDQNRVQKTVCKEESEAKSQSIEFDYIQETVGIVDSPPCLSQELINDPVSINGLEKEATITQESSRLYQEQEQQQQELLEDSSVENDPVSINGLEKESTSTHESCKLYQEQELLEDLSMEIDPVSINGLEKESTVTHKSSKLFQEQEHLEDSSKEGVLKKSQSFSEVLEDDSLVAPPVSESSQSYYDDEEFTDEEEEEEEEEEESESGVNDKDEKVNAIEEKNIKIARKGRMIISEEKDEEGVKLRFRRGKILDLESVNNGPRRLKFRKGKVMEGNEGIQHVSRKSYEKKYEIERNDDFRNNGHESVVLKHQGEKEKKDAQGLFNNVIEETASKLVETRKSKVKALVGAFETVISLQDGKQ